MLAPEPSLGIRTGTSRASPLEGGTLCPSIYLHGLSTCVPGTGPAQEGYQMFLSILLMPDPLQQGSAWPDPRRGSWPGKAVGAQLWVSAIVTYSRPGLRQQVEEGPPIHTLARCPRLRRKAKASGSESQGDGFLCPPSQHEEHYPLKAAGKIT